LPQFINVLKGEMSVVGPRPQVPWAVERYTPEERVILSVRPGITDWASLWVGDESERLRGSTDPDRDYLEKIWPEKRRLQLEYIRTRSLAVDLVIVGKTIKSHILDRLVPRRPRSTWLFAGLYLALATFGFGILVERILFGTGFMFGELGRHLHVGGNLLGRTVVHLDGIRPEKR